MRIISKRRLREYWAKHPDTRAGLENWYNIARQADWSSLIEVRKAFPHADCVILNKNKENEKAVTVFNVCGNRCRLIAAIHYKSKILFVRRIMTHAEYSKGRWKETI